MKFVDLFPAQRLIQQALDWWQTSKAEAIGERFSDMWEDGVVTGLLDNMNIVGKDLDAGLLNFSSVKVDTGVGYKLGERILIGEILTYDSTKPAHTTDNGAGTLIATPRSTGNFDIPLTTNSVNYIWVRYLQTTDDAVFTLHKLTNVKQFYKRTDGYQITVTTSSSSPDAATYILVGSVDLTGGKQAVAANISIVGRDISRTKLERIQIETPNADKTDRPTEYAIGQKHYSLDAHIKGVGTGTITPENVHGLTIADLGVSPNQTVETHRQLEHVSGIIAGSAGTPYPITSALNAVRVVVTPGDDRILVKALAAGEYVICNGTAHSASDFSSDVSISFTGAGANTYQIYFDPATLSVSKTTSDISADATKMWLCTVTWNGTGDLAVPFDRRRFGTFNKAQRWKTTARPPAPISGTMGFNLDLTQMEYFNGSVWIAW